MSVDEAKTRVYLSSTFSDLEQHRRLAAEALRDQKFDVIGMENYVAADRRPLEQCLTDVRSCDLYLGIFAWRYGYIPPGEEQSITELEYREAGRVGLPRLIFLVEQDSPWPDDQREHTAREAIERFRNQLRRDHLVSFFVTAEDLKAEVASAFAVHQQERLQTEIEELRRQGSRSQRESARLVTDASATDTLAFIDRIDQHQELRDHAGNDALRVIKVVGRAGIGKTALVRRTLTELASIPPADGGFDGLLYVSARSGDLSLERILDVLQQLLDDETADALAQAWASRHASLEQKVDALIDLLSSSNYLIVLDALDEALDDDLSVSDVGLRALLYACLGRTDGPLLIVTSRDDLLVPPVALAAVRSVALDRGLSPPDSCELLRLLDPEGDLGLRDAEDADLERVAAITSGIPRAVLAVVGILQDDPVASLGRLLENEDELGRLTVEEIVAEAHRSLGEVERTVMEGLSVFTTPVPSTAVSYLLLPWFPGIDVEPGLRRLVRGHFATASRSTGGFALQPLDREQAYGRLPDAPDGEYGRRTLELRAADFFAGIRKPEDNWRSLDDVQPQLFEIDHCLRAREYDRVLEVLDPIDEHHLALWGHYLRLIELRTNLLDKPVRRDLQAANLAGLASYHQVFGEYGQAVDHLTTAVQIARDEGDRAAEIRYTGNLGRAYRNRGELDRAIECIRTTLEYFHERGDRPGIAVWTDRLALAYWPVGRLDEAIELGLEALALAQTVGDRRTEAAATSNLGQMYRTAGRFREARSNFNTAVTIGREIDDRRGVAIYLGHEGTAALDTGEPDAAVALHQEALDIAKALGERREESYQLIGLGSAEAAQGELDQAADHLARARVLDISSTSFLAAMRLGLVKLRQDDQDAAAEAFADSVDRCLERLGRCDRLFAARYCLGTALTGRVVSRGARGPDALDGAATEYRRATENCAGPGIIGSTSIDIGIIGATTGADLQALQSLLDDALVSR